MHRVGLVIALEAQRDVVGLAVDRDFLADPLERLQNPDQIGAERLVVVLLVQDADVRRGHVDFVVGVGPRAGPGRVGDELQAGSGVGQILVSLLQFAQVGVGQETHDLEIERKLLVAHGLAFDEQRFWHGHDFVFVGVRRIDDGHLHGAQVLGVIDRLALFDLHERFGMQAVDDDLVDHHQGNAAVQQNDAGPLAKQQHATGQENEAGHAPFEQLPQDA